ncbi:hypothetical protein GCM10007890_42890 [Methylobacterium tardum]|uniref:Uncharacterized protein n=1 Tax=Methylobacterium tardum TaxID=374432 RepID=A0AA37TE56_9HYPH|nr:hypothetical protein GCM10007890_42890 [Methylobacterium tardum]
MGAAIELSVAARSPCIWATVSRATFSKAGSGAAAGAGFGAGCALAAHGSATPRHRPTSQGERRMIAPVQGPAPSGASKPTRTAITALNRIDDTSGLSGADRRSGRSGDRMRIIARDAGKTVTLAASGEGEACLARPVRADPVSGHRDAVGARP